MPFAGRFKHFKKQTLDQTVLLGPNTLYSLPNSLPLPRRKHLILTSKQAEHEEKLIENFAKIQNKDMTNIKMPHFYSSLNDILANEEGLIVMGGAKIYALTLPYCHFLIITKIHNIFNNADCFLNEYEEENWSCLARSKTKVENGIEYHVELSLNLNFISQIKNLKASQDPSDKREAIKVLELLKTRSLEIIERSEELLTSDDLLTRLKSMELFNEENLP